MARGPWDKLKYILFHEWNIKRAYKEVFLTQEDLVSPGISACMGCGAELAMRFALRVIGKNSIMAAPPGCMSGVSVVGYQQTAGAKIPVFFPLLDNTAAMMGGIKRHYDRLGKKVHVFAFAGDGGTADAGFQSLSGAAERGENVIYICYDNEGYMNTGEQRSGTTPWGSWTNTTPVGATRRGKPQVGKDLPLIMAMHGIPYVATANMGYPDDYMRKLRRAMEITDGMSYIHLFSPCPTGWKHATELTMEVNRLAVETGLFPLWEMDHGKFRFTKRIWRRKPIREYTKTMGKYAHLTPEETAHLQRLVDERLKRTRALAHMR